LNYRNERVSTDSGRTWGEPARILGELNGQAGDGYAIDGAGRIHFFSQIRFPQGIYHAVWDGEEWSTPELVYFIRMTSDDDLGDNVHAHRTYPIIRAGNQLILTFTDPPPEDERRLFVMQKTLTDILPTTMRPTPTPVVTPESEPTLTPTPPPATLVPSFGGPLPPTGAARPDRAVWLGIAPVLLLLLAAFSVLYLRSSRAR
jgi:hypothetical protein